MLKDIINAQQASLPHQRASTATLVRIRALLEEREDDRSPLSPAERAERSRELHDLEAQLRQQHEAAGRPMDELKERYPGSIK
jgi:hypothetical protein